MGMPCVDEYKFLPDRKFRIDHAIIDGNIKIAIEEEGGIFTQGRHTRPMGFLGDLEKYNLLTEAGYYLLRYPPKKINYQQIKKVYDGLKNRLT